MLETDPTAKEKSTPLYRQRVDSGRRPQWKQRWVHDTSWLTLLLLLLLMSFSFISNKPQQRLLSKKCIRFPTDFTVARLYSRRASCFTVCLLLQTPQSKRDRGSELPVWGRLGVWHKKPAACCVANIRMTPSRSSTPEANDPWFAQTEMCVKLRKCWTYK